MADPDFDRDRFYALSAVQAEMSDFEFEDDLDEEAQKARFDEFEAQFREGRAEYDDRYTKGAEFSSAEDFSDADFVDVDDDGAPIPGSGTEEPMDKILSDYLKQIRDWKGQGEENKNEFVNNAALVDLAREERLDLARKFMLKPELISDPRLGENIKYLNADLAYISRSDASSSDYSTFMQRRAELRDQMFQGDPVVTSEDYAKVAGRAQRMIAEEKYVDYQYDLIDLRKEAALEHFDDPRFITEVYRNKKGLMDELLVDFDRKDLLKGEMGQHSATAGRSQALAETFDSTVKNDGKDFKSGAEKVRNFQMAREVGLNIRHNQRAIAGFADLHPKDGVHFERGMAALDNTRWSEGLWPDYSNALSNEQKTFIKMHKGPAAAFKVAREQFEKQFDAGDPDMAKSFAVMEQAASKIEHNSRLQEKLATIGGAEDVAALHMFSEKYRETALGKSVSEMVDNSVTEKMKESKTLVGLDGGRGVVRQGSLTKKGKSGEEYGLKLGGENDNAIEVIDGAHVRIANSQSDLDDGKGIVMRLDGIVAPPNGVSTKSGKLDAGLEAKANLEAVIKRHGISSLGMKIQTSQTGEETIQLRTADGENVSQRMLRDGYALPTKDNVEGNLREYLTKQAEGNGRGLWREGFPDMDQSWRREKDSPNLTWVDKRLKLTSTVNGSLCHTQMEVARNLTRSETKIFALPLNKFAGSNLVDREIAKVVDKNPSRIMDIYSSNMEILEDLRKRKDKLTQPEKIAHDQLALGRRALGQSLVDRNLLDPKQFKKDSAEMLSRKGIQLNLEGVRKVADATGKIAEAGVRQAMKHGSKAKRGLNWLLDEAMN
jgi:endonuclease YncB( thermonuclease family)